LFPKHLRTDYPAKFAPGLIRRIYQHCLERGYLEKGSLVVDPFAGIGGGGIMAAYAGLNWIGVELEEKFVRLAKDNFEMHEYPCSRMGYPQPVIIQGDSRRLSSVLQEADLIATSPPFMDSMEKAGGINPELSKHIGGPHSQMNNSDTRYGSSPGQIGNLKSGSIGAVCTSPPFSEPGSQPSGNMPSRPVRSKIREMGLERKPGQEYGNHPSNIGNLKAGDVGAVVTSPPWEDSIGTKDEAFWDDHNDRQRNWRGATRQTADYGSSQGQIGQEQGQSYWEACRDVYAECHKILKPGGVIVIVVKSYVKGGKRVPLPMQTLKLLIHLGFEPLERIKASLVKETVTPGLFGEITKTVERKSFFRRLHEKKRPDLKIDFEEILICRK